MSGDANHLLGELLLLAAMVAATIEYAEILRRRLTRRAWAAEQRVVQDSGLEGLVRVFLAER